MEGNVWNLVLLADKITVVGKLNKVYRNGNGTEMLDEWLDFYVTSGKYTWEFKLQITEMVGYFIDFYWYLASSTKSASDEWLLLHLYQYVGFYLAVVDESKQLLTFER